MNPVPYILWFALGSAQLIFVGITFMVPGGTQAELGPMLVLPALVTATLSAGGEFIPPFKTMPPQTRAILRWALAEAAGLFGFVAWMVAGNHTWSLLCAGIGLAAWAFAFPFNAAQWPQPTRRG